jgi:hypothetical protein
MKFCNQNIMDLLMEAGIFSSLFLTAYKLLFKSHFLTISMPLKILIFVINFLSWILIKFITYKLKEYIKNTK